MVNDIINAVAVALNAEFGDSCEIHTEHLEQGFEGPCFFVFTLEPSEGLFRGLHGFHERRRISIPLVIQYFPAGHDVREECDDVSERLFDCLEYITCIGEDRPVYGSDMHYSMTDQVLSFFVTYDLFTRKDGEAEPMEVLTQSTRMKEE